MNPEKIAATSSSASVSVGSGQSSDQIMGDGQSSSHSSSQRPRFLMTPESILAVVGSGSGGGSRVGGGSAVQKDRQRKPYVPPEQRGENNGGGGRTVSGGSFFRARSSSSSSSPASWRKAAPPPPPPRQGGSISFGETTVSWGDGSGGPQQSAQSAALSAAGTALGSLVVGAGAALASSYFNRSKGVSEPSSRPVGASAPPGPSATGSSAVAGHPHEQTSPLTSVAYPPIPFPRSAPPSSAEHSRAPATNSDGQVYPTEVSADGGADWLDFEQRPPQAATMARAKSVPPASAVPPALHKPVLPVVRTPSVRALATTSPSAGPLPPPEAVPPPQPTRFQRRIERGLEHASQEATGAFGSLQHRLRKAVPQQLLDRTWSHRQQQRDAATDVKSRSEPLVVVTTPPKATYPAMKGRAGQERSVSYPETTNVAPDPQVLRSEDATAVEFYQTMARQRANYSDSEDGNRYEVAQQATKENDNNDGNRYEEAVKYGSEVMHMLMSSQDSEPCPVPLPYLERCTGDFSESRKLGEGSFSCVYEGKDRSIRRKFAVKRLRVRLLVGEADLREAKNTFEREIATLKHFRHPNIARMYAYCLSPDLHGDHCLVYELASNGSLHEALKNKEGRDKLHWTTRINIALDLSKALEYLHGGKSGQICFHRDIKCANVCLRQDYTALLIDCGVSKMIPDGESNGAMTITVMESATGNGVRGTPGYICPMFARRMGRYSSANDVFSLGVVLAEIFTGTLQNSCLDGEDVDMFDRYSADGMEKRDLQQDADISAGDWDGSVCGDFARLIVECLSLNPGNRPSIGDIMQRLGGLAAKARPRSSGERNQITVLSSAPLVYVDAGGELQPLSESPNFAMERDLLVGCIKESRRDISLKFDTATDDRLQVAVTRRCGCLHFSGHGHPGCLLFEDGKGGAHWMGEEQLYDCVHEEPFRFVFVSACYSMLMGQALVKAGVRHVVCCEHDQELRDDAAMKFTHTFYFALAEGYTVKAAFEKGKMAVQKRFEQDEVDKYVLLPEDADHDVPLFDADVLEWNEDPMQECVIPNIPPNFLGREIDTHNLLQLILKHNLVNLVGQEEIGCSSLTMAASHYIRDRKSSLLGIDSVYFLQKKESDWGTSAILLEQLHSQLVKEGKAQPFPEARGSIAFLESSLVEALGAMKALIVFNGVEAKDGTLLRFAQHLLKATGTSRLLLSSTAPLAAFSGSSKAQVYELGPLNPEATAILFGKACPHADTPSRQNMVLDKVMEQESLITKIGKGIPGRVIKAAKVMGKEDFAKLFE